MRQHIVLSSTLLVCLASIGQATAVLVPISVNTSSISGTTGSLDLQFNPGPLVTQPASLAILNFTSDGTLNAPPILAGDVSGALPSTIVFDNATAFNDYFEDFTFGSRLSFTVELYGSAVSFPNGTATSGSEFAFSMFSDAAGTIPTLTTDVVNGFAATVGIGLNSKVTSTDFSPQTSIGAPVVIPEPGTFIFVLLGTFMGGWLIRRRNLAV